jgi:fatty-acyl-CoA synthase
VPKRMVFVEELPKNPSGKILKRELRDQHAQTTTRPRTGAGVLER